MCILSKEIILGKDGKDNPLIMWELPWEALFKIGSGSNVQEWHPWLDEFRTFLSSVDIELKLRRLQVILN